MLGGMKAPHFVRPLTDTHHETLTAGLRSCDAFTLRRCQILLANARGERPSQIAGTVGCTAQTVRDVIHAFDARETAALSRHSSCPATTHLAYARKKPARPPDSPGGISPRLVPRL